MKRPLTLVLILLAGALLFALFGPEVRDLAGLRAMLARLEGARAAHPLLVAALYFLAYVVVTALSLPVALWMTIGAGALFGFWTGLAISSFAAATGATLAFLAARLILRDWVAARFGARLRAVSDGIARDGAFYLFSLRLIPVIPFFVINLVMALTPIRTRTFYLVSQIGMLAGAAVYVNAGTRLAGLTSLAGILSPGLLASFLLLAIFPWAARALIGFLRQKRVYSGWNRPKSFDRNLIVIGGGAAGLVSSYIAAAAQAKVTLVEAGAMGGDCLNYGCVPSKALIKSARIAHEMRHAGSYGLPNQQPAIDFPAIFRRIGAVIAAIAPHDSVERYTGLGVEVLQGRARIVDPWTVTVTATDGAEVRLTSRAIILATGAAPIVPPLPGLDQTGYLTSDTLWESFAARDAAPGRLVILGGGPIGCELAQAFARLGVAVTIVEMAPRVLAREDEDVAAFALSRLAEDGVEVLTGHRALACGADAGAKWIEVDGPGGKRRLGFDDLLIAVGRTARLTGFGLEELGIRPGRVVETNDYLETLFPNIYAAGDVAGPYQLTHAAAHQAWFATVNALFGQFRRFRADYRALPAVTFLDPEIARVGLTEAEARARSIAFEVTRYGIDDLDRALTDSAARGFVKVLTVPGRDRILGATIVGEHAGELIAEFTLAMRHGLGLGKILGTVHAYPTFAEANKYAAGVWRKAHVNPRLLALVRRFHDWRRG